MKRITNYLQLHVKKTVIILPVVFLYTIWLSSCKKDTADMQAPQSAQAQTQDELAAKWGSPNITVHKGQSIQAAVNKAKSGSIIFIEPGTYSEAIVVSKPGIKLIGEYSLSGGGVIIKNPDEEEDGISVTDNGDGFTLANVTVENFEENGVYLDSVDNFTIWNVTSLNNDEYGIFPAHSSHGIIKFCTVTGSADTGIYVGQSSNVSMQFNTAYANVSGLEVENSSYIDVSFNQSYNNVTGILVDLLPFKDIKTSSNVHVYSNHVYNNNHVNFGDPGDLASVIPPGTGILVLGTDKTTIDNNKITGNNFTGITVFSTLVLATIAGIPPDQILADVEPYPNDNKISNNLLKNNGTAPPVIPGLSLPGVDLLYDGSGSNNCWSNNIFTSSYPSPLPSCN